MGRIFGFLSVIIVMGAGMYIYSRQAQSSSAALGANSPKAAINITGVRTDLMTIAQAERGYFALEGKYASLDELIASHSLSVTRQRPPYTSVLRIPTTLRPAAAASASSPPAPQTTAPARPPNSQ